jgi:hypothetical protein
MNTLFMYLINISFLEIICGYREYGQRCYKCNEGGWMLSGMMPGTSKCTKFIKNRPLMLTKWRNVSWLKKNYVKFKSQCLLIMFYGNISCSFIDIYLCFHTTTADLSSCHQNLMAHKAYNIFYLALYRKNLLTPCS